mgnify:CR=1 FL=1
MHDDLSLLLNSLNDAQRQAVAAPLGRQLVLAGAGSGKTRVLVHRIAWLHQVERASLHSILSVTFTNKAAAEMRQRIEQLLHVNPQGMWVGTFHGLAHRLLRAHWREAKLAENFQILDSDDQQRLVKRVIRELGLDEQRWPARQAQWWINAQKDEGLRPRNIQAGGDLFLATQLKIYEAYEAACARAGVIDFAELLLRALDLWRDKPDLLAHYQKRFRHILVDEFQDTNAVQYAWLRLLAKGGESLMVVGDDDQSIYGWRGARIENIQQFSSDFADTQLIRLEQNYRSTSRILKCANILIANNPHVFEKQLWSEMGHGDEIRVIRTRNEEAECERVALEILTEHLRTQRPYSDFAILYRGNYQAKLMELKLQHHQIPYRLSGGTSFFARQEVKDLMSYFRLLVNPDDDNAFLRVINVPRREIGSTTLEKLGNYASERGISMYAAADEIGLGAHLDARFTERLARFKRWMDGVRQQCAQNDPIAAIRSMVMDIDYENWLRQNASSDKVADARMGNVWFLVDALKNTLEKDEDGDMTIEDAIGKLVLRDMLERQQEEEEGAEGVQMMTMHASKGLEFPSVYIIGFEEEILPHRSSIEADTIEEERRLAYVGITRAKRNLALTFAAKRKQYGEVIDCTPSRFLDELPPEDLVWEGMEEAPVEVKAARGNDALAAMRAMLKR